MLRSAARAAKPGAAVSRALATNATRISATRSPAAATRTFVPRRNKQWQSIRAMSTQMDIGTENFKVVMHPNNVAVVTLDIQGSPVNVIGETLTSELPPIVAKLEANPDVKAIVFISGKKSGFIAGADIAAFGPVAAEGKQAVKGIASGLQAFLTQMEAGKPKIAAISGSALGGGAEFALACHFRIATSPASIGFPEVQLGLLPGGGGTNRLPNLVGVQNALPMLLQGGNKKASAAKKMGLIDHVCEEGQLDVCAITMAGMIANGELKIPKRGEFKGMYKYIEKAIADYDIARNYVFGQAKTQVMKASGGNYPAPLQILETLKKNIKTKSLGKPQGYDLEADVFADLALTPESEGLQAVFFGSTALKKNPFKGAKKVERVGVLGAGLMGAGIAEVSINKGLVAVLKDLNPKGLAVGETNIINSMTKKVKKKKMTAHKKEEVLARLVGVTDEDPFWQAHFGKVDLVIEAVFENLDLKHRIVKQMEEVCKPDCIIATNTSGIPVRKIAEFAQRPENIVGMHYFSPVTAMPLVEIIPHAGTSEEVTATAVAVALKQGKFPVVVKDVAGFFVNRCLGPYIDESMVLAFEMEDYLQMDSAMKKFGFPVGPITLADEVGVEVAFHLHANLQEELGVRVGGANVAAMNALLAAGIKGKRFGAGMASYPGKPKGGIAGMFAAKEKIKMNPVCVEAMKPFMKPGKVTDEEIKDRISARFINEAIYCLQDGVVRNATDGDMACIFGVGFPPFTGGPFRYLDRVGAAKYCDALKKLEDKYGPRFTPAPLLVDMARNNTKFYNK